LSGNLWRHPGFSVWQRAALFAQATADDDGLVVLEPGRLREEIAVGGVPPNAQQVSNAVRRAVEAGLLRRGSHAGCLIVLPRRAN
jgi:hypothetical protein